MLMARAKDTRQMVVYGYARLIAYDRDYRLRPDILEAIDSDGDRSFTLRLRPGHRWSDGHPFTSEDFRYYWEDVANNQMLSPTGPPARLLVEGEPPRVEMLDQTTVRYSWSRPNKEFLPALSGASPLFIYRPAHYLKGFHEKHADPAALEKRVEDSGQRNWASLHNIQRQLVQVRQPGPADPATLGQHHQGSLGAIHLRAQPVLLSGRRRGPPASLYRPRRNAGWRTARSLP